MTQSHIDILKNMTLEELWELFPIILMPHNPEWKVLAEDEIQSLSELLADFTPIINHIGSTAIPDIMAKPIIDILVEISPDYDWIAAKETLEKAGYVCMSESKGRMSFNKGYTPTGYAERVFHIHIHALGDNDEIRFRDYLIQNPPIAKEYEDLKISLLPKYRNNRDGYTEAKSEFIRRIMALARKNVTERKRR